jgi:hypothetical protein
MIVSFFPFSIFSFFTAAWVICHVFPVAASIRGVTSLQKYFLIKNILGKYFFNFF